MSATQKVPTKSAFIAFVLQVVSPGGGYFYLGRWGDGVCFVGLLLAAYLALVFACFEWPIVFLPSLGALWTAQLATAIVLARSARRVSVTRRIWERPLVICVVGVALWSGLRFAGRAYVAESFRIPAESHGMEPVLVSGDQFFVAKLGVLDTLAEGDIIAFHLNDVDAVKRITRCPGQDITMNGREIRMRPDEYFVIGDNRDSSYDSRQFGPIKRDEIIGKVVSVWWSKGPEGIRWDQIRSF